MVGHPARDSRDPPLTGRVDLLRGDLPSLASARVADAPLRQPLIVEGDLDLVSLCRELSARHLDDALVRDGGRIGIFTTTDLRDALLRPEPPDRIAVRELAHFETVTVAPGDALVDALLAMLRHRIRRVVVAEGDAIVGLLGQPELMGHVASHSHLIAAGAAEARDLPALAAAARQVQDLIALLHADGIRADVIAGLVGGLNRRIFRRLWELLAPPGLVANSCLVVMGSEGRGEQIIRTDQDNALILRDDFDCPELEAVTAAFTAALVDFGYPPCPGGIMLSRPAWRQPLAGFRATLGRWIHGEAADGPMNLAIFLDAAVVAGDATLHREARAHLGRLMTENAAYLARFARAIEQFTHEEGGWWSRLPGLSGRAAAEVDLKKLGLFPVVHGVRALALEAGLTEVGTVARLEALVAAGRIEPGLARDLTDALRCLMAVKLTTNLAQIAEGRAPDNRVRPAALGSLDRAALKDSLAIVRGFRTWIAGHFRLDLL